MLRDIKLYLRFSAQNIRGLMEYKNDFIISTIAGAVWQAVGLVFLFALFNNIHSVAGWSLYEVALLYACVMFGEGTWTFLFQGTTGISYRIRIGDFDRYMLRPASLVTQILGIQINFAGLCSMITSISLIVFSLAHLSVSLNIGILLLFAVNLVLGVCIRVNIDIMVQSLAFWLVTLSGTSAMLYKVQEFAKYPITIYPKAVRAVLVSVLPHAMISYIPVCLLIGKLSLWPYMLAVPASVVFITYLRRLLFNGALKKYESAGN